MGHLVDIWKKWRRRVERIHVDLQTTVNDRVTFAHFGEVVRANAPWIDARECGVLPHFLARQYVRATAMGIRRHCKDQDDSCSMTALLRDMSRWASEISRSFYDERLPLREGARDWRTLVFGKVSEDGQKWSASIIDADVASLDALTTNVETFADRVIAHVHKTAWDDTLTFKEIFDSVDRLDELFCKYYVVLTGHSYSTLKAGNPINWERLLAIPLVEPSNKALNPAGLRPAG